jgi:hypothetical protein
MLVLFHLYRIPTQFAGDKKIVRLLTNSKFVLVETILQSFMKCNCFLLNVSGYLAMEYVNKICVNVLFGTNREGL